MLSVYAVLCVYEYSMTVVYASSLKGAVDILTVEEMDILRIVLNCMKS